MKDRTSDVSTIGTGLLARARAVLAKGETPEGAKARLHDIDVEEVSLVDRAANRRAFIVRKNDDRAPRAEREREAGR